MLAVKSRGKAHLKRGASSWAAGGRAGDAVEPRPVRAGSRTSARGLRHDERSRSTLPSSLRRAVQNTRSAQVSRTAGSRGAPGLKCGQVRPCPTECPCQCFACVTSASFACHRCAAARLCVHSNFDRTPSTCPWRDLHVCGRTVRFSSHTKAHMGRGGPVVRVADRKTTVSRVHPP